ncbi:alpha/beta hydrolase [bacterium]|nr:MAG: alpha/beta hydrolase [bacterium]
MSELRQMIPTPKFALLAALSVATSLATAHSSWAAEPTAPTAFVLNHSETFDLKSKAGRDYQIFVAAPVGEAPPEGYPIVYASDGNAMFPIMTSIANVLSMDKRAIFVGIGYRSEWPWDARRNFDLTPPTPVEAAPAPGTEARPASRRAPGESGGNEVFLEFIETELKPAIEARYKVDKTHQTLFGHSYGGLFTLHALFSRPGTFQTYIAAAPSIFYGNQAILKEAKAFKAKALPANTTLKLLLTHNTEPRRPDARPDGPNTRNREEGARILADDLKTVTGLTTEYRHYDNESHVSMLPGSITAALLFAVGETPRTPRR